MQDRYCADKIIVMGVEERQFIGDLQTDCYKFFLTFGGIRIIIYNIL